MKIVHTEDYRELRAKEYPPLEDYIDAVYWQGRGDSSKMTDYLVRVDTIKAKYPKIETTMGLAQSRF
jgi:hypothetical protein